MLFNGFTSNPNFDNGSVSDIRFFQPTGALNILKSFFPMDRAQDCDVSDLSIPTMIRALRW